MQFEKFVSEMMKINTMARLWHWGTDTAQHHVTFEQFLTQNTEFTDSFVESLMGNDQTFKVDSIDFTVSASKGYSLEGARSELSTFRSNVISMQQVLEKESLPASNELIAILDDVVEGTSKTLYLLKLK